MNLNIFSTALDLGDIVAAIALLLSLSVFYWTTLRGPSFICASIRIIKLIQKRKGNPFIITNLTISNTGARMGVIDYLYLTLRKTGADHVAETFWAFYESKDGKLPDTVPDSPGDYPSAFAIDRGISERKCLAYISDHSNYKFDIGTHELRVYAVVAGRRRPVSLKRQMLQLEMLIEPGDFRMGVALHREQQIKI